MMARMVKVPTVEQAVGDVLALVVEKLSAPGGQAGSLGFFDAVSAAAATVGGIADVSPMVVQHHVYRALAQHLAVNPGDMAGRLSPMTTGELAELAAAAFRRLEAGELIL